MIENVKVSKYSPGTPMQDRLRKLLEEVKTEIGICESIKGAWDGDNPGRLEELAGTYGDVQDRLESVKEELLEAIKIINEDNDNTTNI